MYIEEINRIEGCTLKLSSVDVESGHTTDFDVTLSSDASVRDRLFAFLKKKNIPHFIIIDNVFYENKKVDFASPHVENTLYMTQTDGVVYRWRKVGVSFIRFKDNSLGTCVLSNQDAEPYNRRDTFRVPIDEYGTVLWSGEETPEECMVLDISHTGVGILMEETKITPAIGYPAEISWTETMYSDEAKSQVSTVYKVQGELVRLQNKLGGKFVVGFRMKHEPDPVRALIQKIQTSRGVTVKETKTAPAPPAEKPDSEEAASNSDE